jgi:hypothetical protein
MAAPSNTKNLILPIALETTGDVVVQGTLPGCVPAGHVAYAHADFDVWQVDDLFSSGAHAVGFTNSIMARHNNGTDGFYIQAPIAEKAGVLAPFIVFDPTTGDVSLQFDPDGATDTFGITGELSISVFSWPNTVSQS